MPLDTLPRNLPTSGTLPVMRRILCVGLGNPGQQYFSTRHNAGWIVLDQLVERWADHSVVPTWKREKNIESEVLRVQQNGTEWIFLKPQTFMNDSGRAVSSACKWYLDRDPTLQENSEYPDIIVFHDDLDIETGRHKLQFNSGPKVHNGVNSIREALHSPKFWTVRLGVDSRNGDRSIPGHAYVLQAFSPDDLTALKQQATILAEELSYTVLQ